MKCAWDKFMNLLPINLRQKVRCYENEMIFEVRLRLERPVEIITGTGSVWLDHVVNKDDLTFCLNIASRYSPWSASTAADGYITAPGGHRVGICGQAVTENGLMQGIRTVTSVCIRTARDMEGIATKAAQLDGSILILGRPGSGKTTLLRDLIRQLSTQYNIAVVDEREELYPISEGRCCFDLGKKTDILYGCKKPLGIETVLRTMNPDYIAVDEITAPEDCVGLLHAGWCGVKLLATAHAQSRQDLLRRPVYKPLVESGIFDHVLVLQPNKTWRLERVSACC